MSFREYLRLWVSSNLWGSFAASIIVGTVLTVAGSPEKSTPILLAGAGLLFLVTVPWPFALCLWPRVSSGEITAWLAMKGHYERNKASWRRAVASGALIGLATAASGEFGGKVLIAVAGTLGAYLSFQAGTRST